MRLEVGQLLDVAYNIEYGAESSEQSSLNLIYLLGYSRPGEPAPLRRVEREVPRRRRERSDPARLAERLAGPDHDRLAAHRDPRQRHRPLGADVQAGRDEDVTADQVVLALPFSILRSSVDFSRAGLEPLKVIAMREQGMGTNSKLHVQFKSRPWRAQGYNGETFADRGYQNTWEVTRAQSGAPGSSSTTRAGTRRELRHRDAGLTRAAVPRADRAGPARDRRSYNGKATIDFWPGYRWTQGSYSYWKVGQYTKFAGMEGRRQGTCHFAGEHTSIDFQGYLNGAVETGQRAARRSSPT